MWVELALSLQDGNGYILTMIIIAFFATVIVFERAIMLQFVYNLDFLKFTRNLRKMIIANDRDRAMNLCKSVSMTSLPQIALRALEAAETDPTTVRGTIEENTIEFLPRVEARLGSLPAAATLIMLMGILGTIDGLWGAFHSIDVLDTAKKQAALSKGIAFSLNPTAMGLIICMMILACHQLLRGMALALTERIHYGSAVLHNLLVPHEAVVAAYAAPPPAKASSGGDDDVIENTASAPSGDGGGSSDDAFDDAAVEDIKDEEEII